MVQAVLEVPEDEAEGKIKQFYDEIKSVLRVPYVSAVFRAIAAQSDYLLLAWPALKPNAQTFYFEQVSDQIRALASDAAASAVGAHTISVPPEAAQAVRVLHYALPKNFFAVAALRWATTGQQPVLLELPRDAKRQIVTGIQKDMSWPGYPAENEKSVEGWVKAADMYLGFEELRGEFEALWRWPQPFQAAWDMWSERLRVVGSQSIPRALFAESETGVTSLPFRMDISPHTLRHAGLSEHQIDAIRKTLDLHHRSLARQIGWIAFLSVAIEGRDRARVSPFPVEVR